MYIYIYTYTYIYIWTLWVWDLEKRTLIQRTTHMWRTGGSGVLCKSPPPHHHSRVREPNRDAGEGREKFLYSFFLMVTRNKRRFSTLIGGRTVRVCQPNLSVGMAGCNLRTRASEPCPSGSRDSYLRLLSLKTILCEAFGLF